LCHTITIHELPALWLKNSTMIGKEKIQLIFNTIDNLYQSLISGNVISLRSGTFHLAIPNEEQVQVLDILVKEKRIKYETSREYASWHDIDPETRLNIVEISDMNVVMTEEQVTELMLSTLIYTIEILPDFYRDSKPIPASEQTVTKPINQIMFDKQISKLTSGDQECFVPDETLQHHTCRLVFKNRTKPAKEQDIIDAAGIGDSSLRPVYDATIAVNKLILKNFGLPKYLKFKAGKVRINPIYQR